STAAFNPPRKKGRTTYDATKGRAHGHVPCSARCQQDEGPAKVFFFRNHCFVLRTRLPPKRPVRSTNEGASAMRSRHSSPTTLLFLLSALLLISVTARADDDTTDAEYEEHARVLRVSLLKVEVSLQRA